MAIRDFYNVTTLEVVSDIYGESCYVAEIKSAPKHGIDIYFGRPVASLKGGRRIILTPELADFVKNTLHLKHDEFDLPTCKNTLTVLRRTLQSNPYKTYQQWLDNPERPPYVTFTNTQENPDTIYDYCDQQYILYSAQMTRLSIPVLKGIEEQKFISSTRTPPEYILTPELVRLITDYRMKPQDFLDQIPIQKQALKRLRRQLGFNLYVDRNTWFAERIDDLIALTPAEFSRRHEQQYENWTIAMVANPIKTLLSMMTGDSEEDAALLDLLEKDWLIASEETRKAVELHCSKHESERYRRGYQILKWAHRVE